MLLDVGGIGARRLLDYPLTSWVMYLSYAFKLSAPRLQPELDYLRQSHSFDFTGYKV